MRTTPGEQECRPRTFSAEVCEIACRAAANAALPTWANRPRGVQTGKENIPPRYSLEAGDNENDPGVAGYYQRYSSVDLNCLNPIDTIGDVCYTGAIGQPHLLEYWEFAGPCTQIIYLPIDCVAWCGSENDDVRCVTAANQCGFGIHSGYCKCG